MEAIIGKGRLIHGQEVATFGEEGSVLGRGPIIGHQESGLEMRGDWFSSALNRQLTTGVSSLTLTIEITKFAEVCMQIRYVSQDYPFVSKNLKWKREQQCLHVQIEKWFKVSIGSMVICCGVFVELYVFLLEQSSGVLWAPYRYSDSKNWFTLDNFFLVRSIVAQITKVKSWEIQVTKQGILSLPVPSFKPLASSIDLIQDLQ